MRNTGVPIPTGLPTTPLPRPVSNDVWWQQPTPARRDGTDHTTKRGTDRDVDREESKKKGWIS